ncbi:anti-sigma factor domain-containing protein [Cohnella cholangitidis]|uniref:Anti-sigma factor domain-containing protein n=1 Tax=Cohnella cholangitidis TaxID=2598458 RepID=A0A7G5C2K2_9BACL|nr:anti-sigma factor domain-containing protein [Cohnella cholangitidis]QMV43436.1 anti-sigma factor domain-containing protein [Cohnella cholangitidis]
MNRGTVMALHKRSAVVLTPDGQFVRVKRQAQFAVGDEISDFPMERAVPRIRRRLLQSGALVSMVMVVLIGFLVFRTPPVVAYVTMDINPSIELGLDAKTKVRELRAVNEDAEALIAGLKYRGRDLETVMNELAGRLIAKHVLTMDDPEIMIASVPVKAIEKQWENNVTVKMTEILNEATKREQPEQIGELEVMTVSVPAEVREEANKNGVSSGKMAFWMESESQGHKVSLETLKTKSLKEIAASWGGVNKVMGKYGQKQSAKENKNPGKDRDEVGKKNDNGKKNNNGKKETDDKSKKELNQKDDKRHGTDNRWKKNDEDDDNDDEDSDGEDKRDNDKKDKDKEIGKEHRKGQRNEQDKEDSRKRQEDNKQNDRHKNDERKDSKVEGDRGRR